jgi:hypothetical protein
MHNYESVELNIGHNTIADVLYQGHIFFCFIVNHEKVLFLYDHSILKVGFVRGKVYLQIIFDRISSIANIVKFGIFFLFGEKKNGVKRSNW